MTNDEELLQKLVLENLPITDVVNQGKIVVQKGITLTPQQSKKIHEIVLQHQNPVEYTKEVDVDALIVSSETAIKVIPVIGGVNGEVQALAWIDTNIGIPLTAGRAALPATGAGMTGAVTRQAFIAILDILDKMLVALNYIARMEIAMRDRNGKSYQ